MKEQVARKKIKALKGLYTEIISFVFVNAILIVIWLALDRSGSFWPKYVMAIWGIVLAFKAYNLGIIPLGLNRISFLTPEWEERKVEELMEQRHIQRKIHLNRGVKK